LKKFKFKIISQCKFYSFDPLDLSSLKNKTCTGIFNPQSFCNAVRRETIKTRTMEKFRDKDRLIIDKGSTSLWISDLQATTQITTVKKD